MYSYIYLHTYKVLNYKHNCVISTKSYGLTQFNLKYMFNVFCNYLNTIQNELTVLNSNIYAFVI